MSTRFAPSEALRPIADRRVIRAARTAAAAAAPRVSLVALLSLGVAGCSTFGLGGDDSGARPGATADYASGNYATGSIPASNTRRLVETGAAAWNGDVATPGMTASHVSLRPGTFARVSNIRTGRGATVRITDRLPSGSGRAIELSRDAAAAIGVLQDGVSTVMIEAIDPRAARPEELWAAQPPSAPNQRAWNAPSPVTPTAATPAPVTPAAVRTVAPRPSRGPVSVEGYDPNLATGSIPTASDRAARAPRADLRRATYLQLGSFRDQRNAERLISRLAAEGLSGGAYGGGFIESAYVSGALYHRVRLGPIASGGDAQRALHDARTLGHNGARVVRP